MENIKRYSTNDCNLTKPLQGYLTRHIKQGDGFLESKTMTMQLKIGSFSVLLFSALITIMRHVKRDNKLKSTDQRQTDLRIDIREREKYGIPTTGVVVGCSSFQPISTTAVPGTRAQPAGVDLLRGQKMPNQREGTYFPSWLPRDRKEKLLRQPTLPAYKRG